MTEVTTVQLGVCATHGCALSIEHMWPAAQGWFSGASLPGSGTVGLTWEDVPKEYKDGLQEEGYCQECGGSLLKESGLPELGACSCERKYSPSDFDRNFCPTCGSPISLPEDAKVRHQTQQSINEFLQFARSLQERSRS